MLLTVGFSKASATFAPISRLICAVERREYSHAYIRYTHPITKISLVTQAAHGLVHQINFFQFIQANIVVKELSFELAPDKARAFLEFLHINLGKPYSRLQLLYIGLKKLCGLSTQNINGSSAYICSEFVIRLCEALDIARTNNADYTTPSDLDKLLQNRISQ